MNALTFKDFLSMVNEDVQQEISKLTTDIAMIDTQIHSRTQPLMQRKQQLQKMLALKQKQQATETNQQPNTQQQPPNQQQPLQQGSQVTTPGSMRAATPGSAPSF